MLNNQLRCAYCEKTLGYYYEDDASITVVCEDCISDEEPCERLTKVREQLELEFGKIEEVTQ